MIEKCVLADGWSNSLYRDKDLLSACGWFLKKSARHSCIHPLWMCVWNNMHDILVYTSVKLFLKFCFTACIIREKEKVNLCQYRTKKRVKYNTYGLIHSIPTIFTAWFKKKIRSNRVSIAARNKSIRQSKHLLAASFHPARNIHGMIQKVKKIQSIRVSIAAKSN